MKNLIFILVLLFSSNSILNACSCFGKINFCVLVGERYANERGLVFRGEFIQAQPVDGFTYAAQFKVLEIYQGEIILPDSPLANDNGFDNSSTTVWLEGGNSSLCYEEYDEGFEGLFAVSYNEALGYTTNICEQGYTIIKDINAVEGYFTDSFNPQTFPLSQVIDLVIDGSCVSDVKEEQLEEAIDIYPNPIVDDRVFLDINTDLIGDYTVEVYNTSGQLSISKKMENQTGSLNVSALKSGIYYLSIVSGEHRYTKKILKTD